MGKGCKHAGRSRKSPAMCRGCKYVPVDLSLILIDYLRESLYKLTRRAIHPKGDSDPSSYASTRDRDADLPRSCLPTVVFEVSHTNGRWPRLIKDAHAKAFSANTSIQVDIGLKIYPNHMKAFCGRRAARGHGMKVMRTTPKFRIDRPTELKLQIPASLMFWGCPAVPPHITSPFCEVALEDFRRELQPLIH
jgi:hypothetical protein